MAFINRAKRKAAKEALEALELSDYNEKVEIREMCLKKEREAMLNAYCAVNQNTCTDTCVHYSKGKVWKFTWMGDKYSRVISPKCKLWPEE